jgi:hypothetical protein
LKAEVELTAETSRKKVRLNNSISFFSAWNKKQFVFNCAILELLDICDKAVSKRDALNAKQVLKEARDKCEHRNKIICIAEGFSV